jgi:SAM-dependent methyltransferase
MRARYYPEVFNTPNLELAKAIILTNEGPGADTETRWAVETPYVLELIHETIGLRSDMVVLDYGCGIGRMAKAMIDASGCFVIGLDTSTQMRALAVDYVQSERFIAVSPEQFDCLMDAGLRVNAAISVWVLQHCFAPGDDIARIRGGLAVSGRAFILNMSQRAVPAVLDEAPEGNGFAWLPDDADVVAMLRDAFHIEAEGVPDSSRTPTMAAHSVGTFWMSLKPRGA